jgi:hypothetical protein
MMLRFQSNTKFNLYLHTVFFLNTRMCYIKRSPRGHAGQIIH